MTGQRDDRDVGDGAVAELQRAKPPARRARHVQVEQDDAGTAPYAQGVKRFLAIACLEHVVAVQPQQLRDCAARIGIVLHQQDRVLVMQVQDRRAREHGVAPPLAYFFSPFIASIFLPASSRRDAFHTWAIFGQIVPSSSLMCASSAV